MTFDPRRRHFINAWAMGAAAATMASPWTGRAFAQTPKFLSDPFTLGVASGDPTPDGFVLWTRLAPEPLDPDYAIDGLVDVICEIAEDEAFTKVVRREFVVARPDHAHSVHVEVSGLRPNRPYFYRFRVGLAVSPIGRTKTTPELGAPLSQLRYAWHSCAHLEHGWFTAYAHMARQNPDVILSLGDYIYEVAYGPSARRLPVEEAITLAEYRMIHAAYKMDKDLQAAHACAPWLYIWDDHEVVNDYQGDVGKMLPGQDPGLFPQRRLAAYKAFFEHQPMRARSRFDAANRMRIYGESAWGDLVSFALLDTRQYRAPLACQPDGRLEGSSILRAGCDALADPNRTLLGARQERWMREQFMRPTSKWTVMVQPTLFSPLFEKNNKGEAVVFNDSWSGYEASRKRITDMIDRRKAESSCVIIGGDMHSFWAAEVKKDYANPESETIAVEFVASAVANISHSHDRYTRMLPENPHIKHVDARQCGYGLADVTPRQTDVKLMAVPNIWRRDLPMAPQKHYVVERGRPVLNPA
jgi:alkaline phosphatase D